MASSPGDTRGVRAGASNRNSDSSLPTYTQGGLSGEFVNIGPISGDKTPAGITGQQPPAGHEPVPAYGAAPYTSQSTWDQEEKKKNFFQRYGRLIGWIVYVVFICAGVGGLGFLAWMTREQELWTQEETPEMSDRKMKHQASLVLLIGFLSFTVSNLLMTVFPYIFRFVAAIVNPGHKKYWTIFWHMRSGVTCLGGSIGTYVSYTVLFLNNKDLLVNAKKKAAGGNKIEQLLTKYLTRLTIRPAFRPWPRILNDVLTMFFLWSVFFFFVKLLMLYVSIHYHYRSENVRIQRTKRMRKALALLWEASAHLNVPLEEPFKVEDELIASREKDKKKFFKKTAPSKIVDGALENQRSSAALAKRIWMSMVSEGCDVLTVEDVMEVLPAKKKDQAQACFGALDENQNGDVTLSEMLLAVIETGNSRRSIYQGITDINHAIGTLDWILVLVITLVVLAFMTLRFVKSFRGLKDAMGVTLLGLSFGFGRTLYEFLNGCIFILLKHAYDVGDRIEVYNIAATMRTSVTVQRISILYTIFRRVDNGKDLQMSNDRLNIKRIENISRSGANREELSIFVGFDTTFTDIEHLKAELQAFVCARENSRDYQPAIEVRLHNIFEMNKLELVVGYYHKSNWAVEELRAARSSKFRCALLAAVRRIPLAKPNGGLAAAPEPPPGFEQEREDLAYSNFTAVPLAADDRVRGAAAGVGVGAGATGVEINEWLGQGRTGMRRRQDPYGGGYPFGA